MPRSGEIATAAAAYSACRAQLTDYPVLVDLPVAWGEMDALGHVNNIVYFRYFESARMAYFEQIDFGDPSTGVGPILAETRCRFRAPLRYPDYITVGARAGDIGPDRFTMDYAIAGFNSRRIVAEGGGLVVCYDYTAHRKAPLPDSVVKNIRQLESGGSCGD